MILDIFYILLGFLLLVKGGDYLVEGAVAIAQRAKLSKMVIGMTVVGFGTSMPELLVSAQSALVGNSGIAIGNVVGSNIANIGLILGISSMIIPIASSRVTLRIDHPFMMLSAVLFVAVAMTGSIERWAGALMVLMLVAFVWYQIVSSHKRTSFPEDSKEIITASNNAPQKIAFRIVSVIFFSVITISVSYFLQGIPQLIIIEAIKALFFVYGLKILQQIKETSSKQIPFLISIILVIVSFISMVYGADKLIEGASNIASDLGVSDRIIGLTIVAVGTSLPELFASVMASIKGESDMAIGNIIGSVTFNILCVIGFSAIICPIKESNVGFGFDYLAMILVSIILWIFLRTHHKIVRWEGLVLTLFYISYMVKTILL